MVVTNAFEKALFEKETTCRKSYQEYGVIAIQVTLSGDYLL